MEQEGPLKKLNSSRLFRYVFSGAVATGVTLLLLYALSYTSIWYPVAASLSYAGGFLLSFTLQKFWTFQNMDRSKTGMQFVTYVCVGTTNIFLNGIIVYVLVEIALRAFESNMSELGYVLSAQVIASALIALISYFIYRYFVFKDIDHQ